MVTNVTVSAVDGPTIVYLQDGSSTTIDSGETKSMQMIERGILTISDGGSDADSAEHPPQYPPEWFVDAMQNFVDTMRALIKGDHVEPY